jgi:hypothetical protein
MRVYQYCNVCKTATAQEIRSFGKEIVTYCTSHKGEFKYKIVENKVATKQLIRL